MCKLSLTKEDDENTKYCEDFCPIHDSIREYNAVHEYKICCTTEMCKKIIEAYVLNLRKDVQPGTWED